MIDSPEDFARWHDESRFLREVLGRLNAGSMHWRLVREWWSQSILHEVLVPAKAWVMLVHVLRIERRAKRCDTGIVRRGIQQLRIAREVEGAVN